MDNYLQRLCKKYFNGYFVQYDDIIIILLAFILLWLGLIPAEMFQKMIIKNRQTVRAVFTSICHDYFILNYFFYHFAFGSPKYVLLPLDFIIRGH